MQNYPAYKELHPLTVTSTNCKVNEIEHTLFCLWDYDTMPHAMLLLRWSVIHYQVTFEGHSGRGSEKSIRLRIYQNLNSLKFAYLKP